MVSHFIFILTIRSCTRLYDTDPGVLSSLTNCLYDVKNWMSQNLLQLNSSKTEILVIGSQHMAKQILPSAGSLFDNMKPMWQRILESGFDEKLCFEQHTTKLVQSFFYHLRNISKIRSMPKVKTQRSFYSFISSRLDCCYLTKNRLIDSWLSRTQLPGFITRTKKHDHITPVLASLHWLPVSFRIDFKILLIT